MGSRVPDIRCPRLGNDVPLAYCYSAAEGRPCGRLFACWDGVLPRLREVVAKRLTHEEWKMCFETPPPCKVASLVEMIRRAGGESEGEKKG